MTDDNPLEGTYALEPAARAVYERSETHGGEDCFETIAAMWSGYLSAATGEDISVGPAQVADLYVLLKEARNAHGEYHGDNDTDVAGYAENARRLRAEEDGT